MRVGCGPSRRLRAGVRTGPPAAPWPASLITGIVKVNRVPLPAPAALGPDAASVRLHQPLADGQTQAETPAAAFAIAAGDASVLPEQVRRYCQVEADGCF